MGGAKAVVIAGIGCRSTCSAGEILAVLARAAATACVVIDRLAVPDRKSGDAGVVEAAATLGLPVTEVSEAALRQAQPRCVTRSGRVLAAVGLASIAEAAALAVAGPDGRLVLPRIADAAATCALAVQP